MPSDKKDVRNRGPPSDDLTTLPLESRLSESPSLDMDLMQFLVIAGFTTRWKPLYDEGDENLLEKVQSKYRARRQKLQRQVKVWETRTSSLLYRQYRFGDLKTLMDLKNYLEERTGKTGIPFVGILQMAYLNSALKHFGIEEIDYHSPQSPRKLRNFVPYNLKP